MALEKNIHFSKKSSPPVLAYIEVDSVEQGFDLSKQMLILGGMGHSASIHTKDNDMVAAFGEKNAGRTYPGEFPFLSGW